MKKQMAASTAAMNTPFFQNVSVVRLDRGLYVCMRSNPVRDVESVYRGIDFQITPADSRTGPGITSPQQCVELNMPFVGKGRQDLPVDSAEERAATEGTVICLTMRPLCHCNKGRRRHAT